MSGIDPQTRHVDDVARDHWIAITRWIMGLVGSALIAGGIHVVSILDGLDASVHELRRAQDVCARRFEENDQRFNTLHRLLERHLFERQQQ